METISNRTAIQLTADLYESALNPVYWEKFLTGCCRTLGAEVGLVFATANEALPVPNFGTYIGTDPEQVSLYQDYYYKPDVRLQRMVSRGLPVATSRMLIENAEFKKCEFFNDFLRRQQQLDMLAAQHTSNEFSSIFIGFHRLERRGQFSRQHTGLLENLRPQISRVLTLQAPLIEVLDFLPMAVLLVTETGKVLLANRSAQRILSDNDGLATVRGRLTSARKTQSKKLRQMIRQASRVNRLQASYGGGCLSIPHPSFKRPYAVMICPIPFSQYVWMRQAGSALVFITDPEVEANPPQRALVDLHGLTPAEARVAIQLIQGQGLNEIPDEFGISHETARSQLKAIFSKTDTHRQGQVIRLLLRSPAGLQISERVQCH